MRTPHENEKNQFGKEKRIETLNKEIVKQQEIIDMIESYMPTSLEERIIHEYAIEGSVTFVANKMNEEGLRIEGP